jgi:probable rRNA maturation factor
MNVTISNRQRLHQVDTRLLKRVTCEILEELNQPDDRLGVVIVDDAEIAGLNQQFHDTPGATDVLTFPYGDGDLTGEIIISVEHAASQAQRYGTTPGRELALYVVHGILHLHGYDDLSPSPRAKMRRAEKALMEKLAPRHDLDTLVGDS